MSKKITNDGSHAVCDAVFTASAGMTKIINAYLTRTDTIWHFRSVMDLYYLCAVGQREVMPSQQNDQHHRTLSQQNNEVEVRDGFDQDAQQNVNAGKQRCNLHVSVLNFVV